MNAIEGKRDGLQAKVTRQHAPTTDLKTALLAANKLTVKASGRKWKLDCYVVNDRFSCDAQNLTPRNAHERKFCITDLWRSDSLNSMRIMLAFARLGGFVAIENRQL